MDPPSKKTLIDVVLRCINMANGIGEYKFDPYSPKEIIFKNLNDGYLFIRTQIDIFVCTLDYKVNQLIDNEAKEIFKGISPKEQKDFITTTLGKEYQHIQDIYLFYDHNPDDMYIENVYTVYHNHLLHDPFPCDYKTLGIKHTLYNKLLGLDEIINHITTALDYLNNVQKLKKEIIENELKLLKEKLKPPKHKGRMVDLMVQLATRAQSSFGEILSNGISLKELMSSPFYCQDENGVKSLNIVLARLFKDYNEEAIDLHNEFVEKTKKVLGVNSYKYLTIDQIEDEQIKLEQQLRSIRTEIENVKKENETKYLPEIHSAAEALSGFGNKSLRTVKKDLRYLLKRK